MVSDKHQDLAQAYPLLKDNTNKDIEYKVHYNMVLSCAKADQMQESAEIGLSYLQKNGYGIKKKSNPLVAIVNLFWLHRFLKKNSHKLERTSENRYSENIIFALQAPLFYTDKFMSVILISYSVKKYKMSLTFSDSLLSCMLILTGLFNDVIGDVKTNVLLGKKIESLSKDVKLFEKCQMNFLLGVMSAWIYQPYHDVRNRLYSCFDEMDTHLNYSFGCGALNASCLGQTFALPLSDLEKKLSLAEDKIRQVKEAQNIELLKVIQQGLQELQNNNIESEFNTTQLEDFQNAYY